MSGLIFRIGAAAVVCAAMSVGAQADPAPIEPLLIPYPSLETAVFPPLTDLPAADAAPSTIGAPPATSTAIPLPAGVYVGLVGLASAAIARRRYLKRR